MFLKFFSSVSISIFLFTNILFSQDRQDKLDLKLSHPLKFGMENSQSYKPKSFIQGSDSFKVVAILVQFQEDSDNRSSGNGKFDMSNKFLNPSTGRDTVVDAPPYDSSYFADHLTFLKNYYTKASKGKINISFDLYGNVITLPQKMEAYSPQRNENNAKLGNLFTEAWQLADAFIDFSSYDTSRTAFVIFHAGVGRDVDLTSIFGFDPTPYDIPSVFLGLRNLKEFFGNSYNGYQTNDGKFIRNSLIIPSTELRELALSSGTFLVELGMNGILTASFGSYLGLPDLFNTSNGKTAIGRFGLMDGQSLFSYNGIFPPEPSAWEKIFLGWVQPVNITSGVSDINIPAGSKINFRDSTIYKVFINSKEYFLIENRNRDPENDGQTIYSRNRTFNDETTFPGDVENGFFYSNNYSSLYLLNGNVTDVQNFDWSLPGLINNENAYKGGLLIWHIDENVIDMNLLTNSINNDPERKGIDLEEAKGAQEIGVTFSTPFGNITGDGTPVDYWFNGYHGVPSSVYKNEFTPVSNPNSLSYSLSNNNIFITNFGIIDTLMSLRISIGSLQLSPLANFPKFIGIDTARNTGAIAFDFIGDGNEEIFVNSSGKTYGYSSNGNGLNGGNGLILNDFGISVPALIDNGVNKYLVSLSNSGIGFLNNAYTLTQVSLGSGTPSAPLLINDITKSAYVGFNTGSIRRFNTDLSSVLIDSSSGPVYQFTKLRNDTFTYINNDKFIVSGNMTEQNATDILKINFANEFFINGVRLNLNYVISDIPNSPVLADVNGDGLQEIMFTGDGKVYAINSKGVLLENFPVNFDRNISSGISVADINNDNIFDLIFAADNGDLFAYGTDGKILTGFPVKVGPNTKSTPAIAKFNDTLGIVVFSGDGYLYGFKTNSLYDENKVLWKNYLKDKFLSNNNYRSVNSGSSAYSEKLPTSKVYNWPNPVYDNITYIRYFLNGNSSGVTVKIMDLSGELVTELPATSNSNSDNEIKWDVSNVQSGVYYGVIEAEIDGNTETKVIKIAVVK
ncbi:MAG: T9SS type A sorting domain-containing protein [Ignavibacteria bacterium]|nr:T9SS type A sorting domain-containing protein [Ignavibacteria bacterium]